MDISNRDLLYVSCGLGLCGLGYLLQRRHKYQPSPEDRMIAQIRKQIGLDTPDSNKIKTLLHRASKGGCSKAVQMLLEGDATVDLKDHKGQTALHKACAKNQGQVIEQLVKEGASIAACDDRGQTPLMLLMQSGYQGEIDFLISKADINIPNQNGDTHLHLAADAANEKWLKSLIAAGANPKAIDGKGQNVLERLFKGQFPFASFVKEYFADRLINERKEHSKEVTEIWSRLNPELRQMINETISKVVDEALSNRSPQDENIRWNGQKSDDLPWPVGG